MNLVAELEATMSFSSLFKKATNLLGLGSPENSRPPPLDGEIIYCKNNVCVHPPAALSTEVEHYPGYLNIRSQEDQVLGSTLILTWIPNSTLKKNPRSIENSPGRAKISPRRSPRQEFAKPSDEPSSTSPEESGKSEVSSPKDVAVSPSPSSGPASRKGTLSESYKSQASDSGISQDLSIGMDEGVKNNARDTKDFPKVEGVGLNINTIREEKDSNVKHELKGQTSLSSNTPGSISSESDSPSTDEQLTALLARNKVRNPATNQIMDQETRRRSSSSRSVTSIEMEGDNLMVVTEEVDESAFLDDDEMEKLKQSDEGGEGENNMKKDESSPECMSTSSDSSYPSPTSEKYHQLLKELASKNTNNAENTTENNQNPPPDKTSVDKLKESLDLKLNVQNLPSEDPKQKTPDIHIIGSPKRTLSESSTSTSGPDSNPPSPITPPMYYSPGGSTPQQHYLESSTESLVAQHNLSFPENAVMFSSGSMRSPGSEPKSAKEQICGVFSVDLGQMRSLRIFYTDHACTSGQLVIASRESQYKILNFHHGGLERLADTLSQWKFLAQPRREKFSFFSRQRDGETVDRRCRTFSVIRPYLTDEQCHPEEGAYERVDEATWKQHMNATGQIEDDFHLRRAIFFAGLDPSLRHEMWPFLLHYYPYISTYEEREHLRNDKYIEYQNLRKQRESMSPEDAKMFWRSVQCTVEKDVVRTDRSHPYFKGEDNPNIDILKNILLNYAVAHPCYGYTQGMSDLLAPVLVEVQNEVDAYWCFVGLMQKTIFVSSPKDVDMDRQLLYLQELLRLMLPHFYEHLQKVQDGMELLFCHRWILLCFKREFPEADALRMWEACWAHYQTDYLHLFICVAIIAVYGEDVVQQDLPADEMLLHFSSLSMHMSGEVVLRKARGLLHQFRTLPKIPCTLDGICTLCGSGMWDSGHVPTIECVGNHPESNDQCPYGGKVSQS